MWEQSHHCDLPILECLRNTTQWFVSKYLVYSYTGHVTKHNLMLSSAQSLAISLNMFYTGYLLTA